MNSKQLEIIDRLYKAGNITLEEVLILCKDYHKLQLPYTPQPLDPTWVPYNPFIQPYTITSGSTDRTELDKLKDNINFTSK